MFLACWHFVRLLFQAFPGTIHDTKALEPQRLFDGYHDFLGDRALQQQRDDLPDFLYGDCHNYLVCTPAIQVHCSWNLLFRPNSGHVVACPYAA